MKIHYLAELSPLGKSHCSSYKNTWISLMQILRCMMPSLVKNFRVVLEKILIHVCCSCTFVFTLLWNYLPLQKWVVLHFNLSEALFAIWMPCVSSGEKESYKSPMSHNAHLSLAVSNIYNFSGKLYCWL